MTNPNETAADDSTQQGALVTGSSSGIGTAIAERLAADGYLALINARSGNTGALKTRDAILAAGHRAEFAIGSIFKVSDIRRLFADIRVRSKAGKAGRTGVPPVWRPSLAAEPAPHTGGTPMLPVQHREHIPTTPVFSPSSGVHASRMQSAASLNLPSLHRMSFHLRSSVNLRPTLPRFLG